jgi:hypothetical protein
MTVSPLDLPTNYCGRQRSNHSAAHQNIGTALSKSKTGTS